jgi:hypothetical protein
MADWKLDDVQKLVQIGFWLISGTVVILTYLRARKGVLSTVNSEYQKRVMDRLQKLSEQFYEEFETEVHFQPIHKSPMAEGVRRMNEEFNRCKDYCFEKQEWEGGIPVADDILKIKKVIGPLKSDPFVPKEIRDLVLELLETRSQVMLSVYRQTFKRYGDSLANREREPSDDILVIAGLQNHALDLLREKGCASQQIEEEVHEIREAIQKYFESFDPR